MSYLANENSIHDGQPVECFEFVGTYETYRYTSADTDILLNSRLFKAVPISSSEQKIGSQQEDKLDVTVTAPVGVKLVNDYAFQGTPPDLNVTIYRGHRQDDLSIDFAIYWQGPVAGINTDGLVAKFRVPSIFSNALAGAVPSVYYQGPCNHVLYDAGCGVSEVLFSVDTTVLEMVGNNLEIASAGGFPDGFFGLALDQSTGEARMLVSHSGTSVVTNFPFSRDVTGLTLRFSAGCDHAWKGDCKNKFDNTIRYGGMPLIPVINIFTEGF